MSDFMPNNRHLREVLIFFFHSKKTAAEVHRKLQKLQRAVIGSIATKTVISMLTTVRVKEGQKSLKTLMLFIVSC